ncbi:MAG: hypothetical protein GY950_27180 [bacterium]|nr:hypothetical protein [bacterium]
MKKLMIVILTILTVGFVSANLDAQSLNLKIGVFKPSLESDLWEQNIYDLAFDKQDMLGTYVGAELEMFMGRNVSLALEAGHYQKEIFTIYRDYEYMDGTSIEQDFFLRVTSLEADIKLYPLGHRKTFSPYIGGGAGLYFWKYYQGGDFVDPIDETVYTGEAYTKTMTPGFNAKAGFVYRYSRSVGISFESKYTYLKGTLSSLFEGFDKLDLSGFTFTIGLNLFLR